mmetsp:Transcript_12834/g.33234  ORF Transcript_12834/g.33234 Transcript_12834/m.33234 type:complete len:393 (-) Transcript_12834:1094-2272(-)
MPRAKSEGKGGAGSSKRGGSKPGGGAAGKDGKKGKGSAAGKDGNGSHQANGVAGQSMISCADIQYVQNLIERCLQQYMTQKDVVFALQYQARIEPGFTTLVWQKLEEQNPDFFMAYHVRVKLKDQVVLFNHLIEQQMQMIQKLQTSHMGGAAAAAWQQKAGPGGMGHALQHPGAHAQANGFPMHPHHHSSMHAHGHPHSAHASGLMGHPMDPQNHHMGMHGPASMHGQGAGAPGGMPPYGDLGPQMGPAMDMASHQMRGGPPGPGPGVSQGMPAHGGEGNQANSVFGATDYSQVRAMHPTQQGSEAPPLHAGLASMNGMDLSQAGEGQSAMIPKVFSLSDLTLELGAQLATDGDVSLSLLAGNESSGLGIFSRNLSLGDIAKLEQTPEAGFS